MSGNYFFNSSVEKSTVIGQINANQSVPMSYDPADLAELRKIQEKLESNIPELAKSIGELRKAIEEQDTPSVKKIKQELSSNLIVSILTNAATEAGKIALQHFGIIA